MTARKDSTTDTPAIASKALTWWKYEVMAQQAECGMMSIAARGIDAFLSDDAWSNPDFSCRVKTARMKARCEKERLDFVPLWSELKASGRWELSEDKRWLIATHLIARRVEGAAAIEQRKEAGRKSGEARRARSEKAKAKAAAKRAKQQAQAEQPDDEDRRTAVQLRSEPVADSREFFEDTDEGNPFDANDIEHTATTVRPEQKTEQTTPELLSEAHGVVVPADAARHAEGAAAPSGTPAPAAPRKTPFIPALIVDQQLRDLELPPVWMDADTAELVRTLAPIAAVHGIDIERAIRKLYAPLCGPQKPEGHVPLRDELIALLQGTDGRAGWLAVDEAPAAVACACFGALAHKVPVIGPILFRGIASATARQMREQADEAPRVLAAQVALDFSNGKRKASAYELPCDQLRPTPRLLGHPTKAEPAA